VTKTLHEAQFVAIDLTIIPSSLQESSMRAFQVSQMGAGYAKGEFGEAEAPLLEKGFVLVAVDAASLNSADLRVVGGELTGRFLHKNVKPLIPGYDFAGTVIESADPGFAVGDEVFGFLPYSPSNSAGTLAGQVAAKADSIAKKPEGVSMLHAAMLGTAGATALQGLRDKLRVTGGQRVLINGGSGGVGSFAVQVAKELGATVVATCSAAKAAAVREMGADEVIDYKTTSIKALPGPFDAIFDAAATSSFAECGVLLTKTGRFMTTLPSLGLLTGKLRAAVSSRSCEVIIVKSTPADLAQLADWIAAGKIKVAGESVPFDEVKKGFERLDSGKVVGKVGVSMSKG